MNIDIEIVRRAQSGDQAALSALIVAHQTYVYSIALGVMHQPADAADMTQEAFLRVMRSLHTYRGETRFTTWLYRLVTNVCLDELRRRNKPVDSLNVGWDDDGDVAASLPDRDRWAQPEEHLALRESSVEVRQALGQLPPMQRLALTLYYFGDLQDREIAEVMSLPVNTVKSHIHRGKARLAHLLGASRVDAPATVRSAASTPVAVAVRSAASAPVAVARRSDASAPVERARWTAGLGTRVAAARPLLVAARAA